MLRRTVAKAFGPQEGGKPPVAPVSQEAGRGAALKRLFYDLFDSLAAAMEDMKAGSGAGLPETEEAGASAAASSAKGDSDGGVKTLPRLTKPRALADGIEFLLEGASTRLRFLYPLRGFIQVIREPSRGGGPGLQPSAESSESTESIARPWELLLVQLQGEGYRPVEKPFPVGLGKGLFSIRPTPFRFTSAPEL